MILAPDDSALFIRLHCSLMTFVNQRLKVARVAKRQDPFTMLPNAVRIRLRECLIDDPSLYDDYVAANPHRRTDEELAIVHAWKNQVAGTFIVARQNKNGALLLDADRLPTLYLVKGLTEPLRDVISWELPVMIDTVLLPFRNQITYDGLLAPHDAEFDEDSCWNLTIFCQESVREGRVITSIQPKTKTSIRTKATPVQTGKRMVRKRSTVDPECEVALNKILALIDGFCRNHLNEEYRVLCHNLARELARIQPCPLVRGRTTTWASGIVRTIGAANFLSVPSSTPTMKLADVDRGFGIGPSTGSASTAKIRLLIDIDPMDPRWTLPSLYDDKV